MKLICGLESVCSSISHVHAPPAQSGWLGRYRLGCRSRSGSRCPPLWLQPWDASVHPCTWGTHRYHINILPRSVPQTHRNLRHHQEHVSPTPDASAHLCAYSSSTLLSPVTALASCLQRAARSPTSIAWFISTTDDSISTATSSSGWDSEPCRTGHKFSSYVKLADYQGPTICQIRQNVTGTLN